MGVTKYKKLSIEGRKNKQHEGYFLGLLGLIPGNLIFHELKFFETNFFWLNGRLLITVGVWSSELSSKFGASIIKGLILSFKIKAISNAVF